jgi:hypothetical protein
MHSPSAAGSRAHCGTAPSSYIEERRTADASLGRACRAAKSVVFAPIVLTIACTVAMQLSASHAEAIDGYRVVRSSCPPACPAEGMEQVWTSIHGLPILAASHREVMMRVAASIYSGAWFDA